MSRAGPPTASPLVACLLITSTSSRGPQLVFRYPKRPQLHRRLSRIRYYAAAREESRDEEAQRDRAQWDEQEEESESEQDLPDSDDRGSRSSSFGDGIDDNSSDSVASSEDETREAHSEDTDRESASDAASLSHTASSSRRGRSTGVASDRIGRLTRRDGEPNIRMASKTTSGSSGPASMSRVARSPSQVRKLSASLRDPAKDSSPEREPYGDMESKSGRRGATDGKRGALESSYRREDSPSRLARNERAFSHYLGYPVDFLAEMLAPTREMCNRKFELVVDDLAFIGHPVYRSAESTSHQPTEQRGRTGAAKANHASDNTNDPASAPEVEMFHLVLVIQPPDPSYATPTLDLTTWLGLWYDNVTFKMTAALWAEEQRCSFISAQNDILLKIWNLVEGYSGGAGPSYALHLSQLLMSSSLARSLRQMFRGLRHPTLDTIPMVTLNGTLDVHLQLPPLLVDPARMVKSILELGPAIEADDADLFGDDAALAVGDPLDEWTRATGPPLLPWKSLLLLHDSPHPLPKSRRYRSVGGIVVELESEEESAQRLDAALAGGDGTADAGIELWARKFTSLLKPTLQGIPTFAEIASLLSWDLQNDVYPMARHLVYYKQAKVCDVPRIQNTYTVNPIFELSDLSRHATNFGLRFSEQPPLVMLLAKIGSSLKPFIAHFLGVQPTAAVTAEPSGRAVAYTAKRKQALEILVWLLRREILIQQHLRFRLIATEAVKRKARSNWEERKSMRAEIRRQREERREWKREKRALKRGADPRRRRGDLVPLTARSAPVTTLLEQRRSSNRKTASTERSQTEAREQNKEDDRARVLQRPLADLSRGRQRSRSAEAQRHGKSQNEEVDPVTARLTSPSRSRSRNPPLLGRVLRSGKISSRPGSAEGAVKHASDSSEALTPMDFQRRRVARSRSPNSSPLLAMTSAQAESSERLDAGSSSGDVGASSSPEQRKDSEVTPSTGESSTGHKRVLSSSSGAGSASGHGRSPSHAGLSSTPRERAAQMLAAEHQQRRRRASSSLARPAINAGTAQGGTVSSSSPVETTSSNAMSSSMTKRGRGATVGAHSTPGLPGTLYGPSKVSRSPSEARLRVRGFGDQDEQVWVDGHEVTADTAGPLRGEGEFDTELDSVRRLSLVGEEDTAAATAAGASTNAGTPEAVDAGKKSETGEDGGEDDTKIAELQSEGRSTDHEVHPASTSSVSDSSSDSSNDESESDSDSDAAPYYDVTPSLIADPSRASGLENAWIAAMVHEYSTRSGEDETAADVVQAFFRLLPYLNGRHTIDEVLCREGMRRRQLRDLLARFKEEIMTFVHP